MQPIRILHVFGRLDSGGAESRIMDIYRQVDKQKVQFDFLIHTNEKGFFEDEIESMGGRIYRVPRFQLKTLYVYPKAIYTFLKKHPEYNIIHGHILSTAFIYLTIARIKGVPVRIAHSRSGSRNQNDIISKIKNTTEKLSRFNATHMFAVSKIAGESKFGNKKIASNQVKVIPNAINSKMFIFNEGIRDEMRKRLDLDNNIVIGHVGRMTPAKNHLFLLEIFNEIKKKSSNAKLVLIGKGPEKNKIVDKISELGLERNVVLLGVRNDVNDLYQAMDVFLFPSTHEGFPGVVLEAQASGLASIISSAITHEVKITNLVEYISLKKDIEYWAERTLNIGTSVKRQNMYEEIVHEGYDIEYVSNDYQNFYLKVNKESNISNNTL